MEDYKDVPANRSDDSLASKILEAFGPDSESRPIRQTPASGEEAVEKVSLEMSGEFEAPTRVELFRTLSDSSDIDPYLLKEFAFEALDQLREAPEAAKITIAKVLDTIAKNVDFLVNMEDEDLNMEDVERYKLARLEGLGESLIEIIQSAKGRGGSGMKFALDLTGHLGVVNKTIGLMRNSIAKAPTEKVPTLMIDDLVRIVLDPVNNRGFTPEYIENVLDKKMEEFSQKAKRIQDLSAEEYKTQMEALIAGLGRYIFRIDQSCRNLEKAYVSSSVKESHSQLSIIVETWSKAFKNYRALLNERLKKRVQIESKEKEEKTPEKADSETKRKNTKVSSAPAVKKLSGLAAAVYNYRVSKDGRAIDRYLKGVFERIKKDKLGLNGYKVAVGEMHRCLGTTRDNRVAAIVGRYLELANKKIDRLEHPVRSVFADIKSGVSKKAKGMFSFLKRKKKTAAATAVAAGAVTGVGVYGYDYLQNRQDDNVSSYEGSVDPENSEPGEDSVASMLVDGDQENAEEKKAFFEQMVKIDEGEGNKEPEAASPEVTPVAAAEAVVQSKNDNKDDDDEYTDDMPDFGTFELDPVPEDGTMWGRAMKAKHLKGMNMWDRLVAITVMSNKVTGRSLTLFVDEGEVLFAPATLEEAREIVKDAKDNGTYDEIIDAYREKRPKERKNVIEKAVPKDRTSERGSAIQRIKRMRRPGPRREIIVQNHSVETVESTALIVEISEKVNEGWSAMLDDDTLGSNPENVDAEWAAMLDDEKLGLDDREEEELSEIDQGWLDIDLDEFDMAA